MRVCNEEMERSVCLLVIQGHWVRLIMFRERDGGDSGLFVDGGAFGSRIGIRTLVLRLREWVGRDIWIKGQPGDWRSTIWSHGNE